MTPQHVLARRCVRVRPSPASGLQQFERLGPLMMPVYGLAILWTVLRGGHWYEDNLFEQPEEAP
jgi:hypothetical protein